MPKTYGIFSLTRNSAMSSPPFLFVSVFVSPFSLGLFILPSFMHRMQRRQISKGHAWAKLRSRPGILPAHDRLHVVSDRVETRDRLPRGIADLRVLVGAQAEAGTHRRGFDLYRIQRPLHNT